MHAFLDFIMGPMVWISVLLFFLGVCFRLYRLIKLAREKESFIFTYLSFKYSIRSIAAWLIPFLPRSTRKSPVFYTISYLFHLLIFMVPIFLLSHVILLEESMQWSWITLNDKLADALTIAIIAALCFFCIRRIVVPEVKFLTRLSDFIFILIAAVPFISGFIAYHQIFAYKWAVIIHVISGELLLIIIPFSRFFHMILAPITRAYTGSEFGGVRHAKDW